MQLTYFLSLPLLLGSAAASAIAGPVPPPAGAVPKRTFTAVGIGASNFTRSYEFYTKLIGLKDTGISIPTEIFDETILASDSGSAFLLMTFKPQRPTQHLPIKLVFGVPDVNAQIETLRKAGYKIVVEPDPVLGLVGMAEDPDGYLLEFNPSS